MCLIIEWEAYTVRWLITVCALIIFNFFPSTLALTTIHIQLFSQFVAQSKQNSRSVLIQTSSVTTHIYTVTQTVTTNHVSG